MKGRLLVLAADRPRPLAALIEDGVLVDLLTDAPASGARPGEIRLGVVRQVLPHAGAATLDIGGEDGFLARGGDVGVGECLIVEVLRAADGTKDARVSTNVSYGGRLLVHTPRAPGINASRKIGDAAERKRLLGLLRETTTADGWVVRTAAAGASKAVLCAAVRDHLDERARVERLAAQAGPGLLREAPGVLHKALTDWPVAETVIADSGAAALAPGAIIEADPLDAADLYGALHGLLQPRAELGGGAWLSVEPTEALVAIDVNAGGLPPREANRLAAHALERQLRLRGLGGVVVVDFAGDPARAALGEALGVQEGLRVAGWAPLGLLVLERMRDRPALTEDIL